MKIYDFRKLNRDQVHQLVSWAEIEGWNPGPHDADLFYMADPDGFYGYFYEEQLIGGGSLVSYNGAFGFMGLFIMKPEFRNHGTKFVDASSWITPQLTATIDGLCNQIEGFYYGRLDIMYASFDALTQGQNFAVVELNGAMSEPAHIYDPSHSIWFAWKTLFKHITYLFEISKSNHAKGHPYLSFKDGIKQYQLHQKHSQKIFKI